MNEPDQEIVDSAPASPDMAERATLNTDPYNPPRLEFTNEDLDAFMTSSVFGEEWRRAVGSPRLRATMRTRPRILSEFLNWVVAEEVAAGEIKTQGQSAARINTLNILSSVAELNGRTFDPPDVPARPWTDAHRSELSKWEAKHPLASLTEPTYFIIVAMMIQFQDLCFRMQTKIVEEAGSPGFSQPGAAS